MTLTPPLISELMMVMDGPPDKAFWHQYHDLAFLLDQRERALAVEIETLREYNRGQEQAFRHARDIIRKREAFGAEMERLKDALREIADSSFCERAVPVLRRKTLRKIARAALAEGDLDA